MARRQNIDHATRARLAKWLRYYRQLYAHHYTRQLDLARALNVSQGTVSQVLSGRRAIGLDVFIKISRELSVSADVLLTTDPPGDSQTRPRGAPRLPAKAPGFEQ